MMFIMRATSSTGVALEVGINQDEISGSVPPLDIVARMHRMLLHSASAVNGPAQRALGVLAMNRLCWRYLARRFLKLTSYQATVIYSFLFDD